MTRPRGAGDSNHVRKFILHSAARLRGSGAVVDRAVRARKTWTSAPHACSIGVMSSNRPWLPKGVGACAPVLVLMLACGGCKSPNNAPQASASVSTLTNPPPPRAAAEAGRTELHQVSGDWVPWLRAGDYQRAATGFDAIYPVPDEPLLRLARAKMAIELGQFDRAAKLTLGLAEHFPMLREEIDAWHWRARAEVSPDLEVARRFEQAPSLDDKLRAVELYSQLGASAEARKLIDVVVQRAESAKRSGLALARRARADMLRGGDERGVAQSDYRWLALHAATESAAEGADEQLEALGEKLTKAQRFERAEKFTSAGMIDATLRELRLMNDAPGPGPRGVAVLRTQAWAYYKSRRDYRKAADLFAQCAQLESAHRVQDSFYSARALSRANEDAEAIVRYEKLARQFPRSGYAEEARFLAARLHFVLGHWQQAERGYAAYLERVRRSQDSGRFAASAREQQVIAQLALGQGAKAEAELARAVAATSDGRTKAALSQLHSVALLQQGKTELAAAGFRRVIEERPLSLGAQLSAARLREMGLEAPLPMGPPTSDTSKETPSALEIELPYEVERLAGVGLDDYAERLLASQEHEFQRAHAPRGGEALCQAYGTLAPARQRFRVGQRVVRERALMQPLTTATRWLWECNYPSPYPEIVEELTTRHDVSSSLVYAIMRQESAFAPHVGSSAGAVGLMQLIAPTAERVAKELGINPETVDRKVPATNIELGVFYLARLLRTFDGNVVLASAGYNAGPGAVSRWLAAAGDQPLDIFAAFIPYQETRNYVRRVLGNRARYDYLQGGDSAVIPLELQLPKQVSLGRNDY